MAVETKTDGDVTNEWAPVCFGDVVRDVKESERQPLDVGIDRYVGLEHIEPQNLHISRWGDLTQNEVSFTKRFRKGQVLFGKRRAYQRKVAIADFDGICSSDILTFEAIEDRLDPRLLPFIVQSEPFFDHALDTSSGSLSPRTRWSQLKDYAFHLPSLAKQRQIAECLCAADECLVNMSVVLKALEETKQVSVAAMMRNGRSTNEWTTEPLGNVANVIYGITVNSRRSQLPDTRPYLRVANVYREEFDLEEVKDIGCTDEEVARYMLKGDDLLVVEGHADVKEIGRAALWRSEIDDCLHQNHLIRVRCKSNLLPKFLVAYLNSPRGRVYFQRFAKSSSGLYTINSTVVKKMLVPCPPLKEQERIVEILTEVNQQISSTELHLKRTHDLCLGLVERFLQPQVELTGGGA